MYVDLAAWLALCGFWFYVNNSCVICTLGTEIAKICRTFCREEFFSFLFCGMWLIFSPPWFHSYVFLGLDAQVGGKGLAVSSTEVYEEWKSK